MDELKIEMDILRAERETLSGMVSARDAEIARLRAEADALRAENASLVGRGYGDDAYIIGLERERDALRAEVEIHRSSKVIVGKCYRDPNDGEVVHVLGEPDSETLPRSYECKVVVAATSHAYDDGAVGTVCHRQISRWVYDSAFDQPINHSPACPVHDGGACSCHKRGGR